MITKRGVKGSPLTGEELDANWEALAPKIVTVTEDTTLSSAHYTVRVDATDDDVVIALPTAASAFADGYGRVYNVKKIDESANTVTVSADAAETIDGAATQVLTAQWQSMVIQSDGTTWSVIYTTSAEGASVFGPSGDLALPDSDEGEPDQVLASDGPGNPVYWHTLPPPPVTGRATLIAGSKLVFADVTALSVIHLTVQSLGTVEAPMPLYVSAKTIDESFTITSADATDTSIVGWTVSEPTQ